MAQPSLRQPAQGLEQPLDLLRRQHRGRLVHDQQLRLLQQAAHDLDALPLADRQVVHRLVGIEMQAVGLGDLRDARRAGPCGRRRRSSRARCSPSTVSASNSEKCWNTMPMPSRRAWLRVLHDDGLALPADLAGIGLQHAVDDLDQRALAGAVLAEQRVDLAGQDSQVDAIVGEAARKLLHDAAERQERDLTFPPPCSFPPALSCPPLLMLQFYRA